MDFIFEYYFDFSLMGDELRPRPRRASVITL